MSSQLSAERTPQGAASDGHPPRDPWFIVCMCIQYTCCIYIYIYIYYVYIYIYICLYTIMYIYIYIPHDPII